MKKYLVSFATAQFKESQKKLIASARRFGIDGVFTYTRKSIRQTEFYRQNKTILDSEKGAGYWLWKPYCILDAMSQINDGDLIFYADAGAEVIGDLTPLYDLCARQGGILLFQAHGHLNKVWIKRDCFVLMDCDAEQYWKAEQVIAGYGFYIKNGCVLRFLEEWLKYGCNPNIITDAPNISGLPNFPEFKENRHDQAILSLLAVKHGLRLFRNPSQWGEPLKHESRYADSLYPTVFNLHRTRTKPGLRDKIRGLLTGDSA